MATVSELTSKNIASAQANVQTWGNVLYNVKVYGAKGDGVTDDTIAIQAAINAIGSLGGTLLIPSTSANIYLVSATLTLPSNITVLIGEGVTLKLSNGANCPIFQNSDIVSGNTNITIIGGVFDSNQANQTANFSTIQLTRVTYSHFKNMEVNGNYTIGYIGVGAWDLYLCNNVLIANCKVYNSSDEGLYLRECNNCTVNGGKYYDNPYGSGVATEKGEYNEFINVTCRGNTGSNFSINGKYSKLIGCTSIDGLGLNGITMGHSGSPADYSIVSNCIVHNNQNGIGVQGSSTGVIVSSNQVLSNNLGTGSGVIISDSSSLCIVTENYVNDNKYGIYISTAALANTVKNNIVRLNILTGITINATNNTIVEGNVCENNATAGTGYGIYVSITSQDNIITNNRCFDSQGLKTQQRGIFLDGTKNVVANNIVWGNSVAQLSSAVGNFLSNNVLSSTDALKVSVTLSSGTTTVVSNANILVASKLNFHPTSTGATSRGLYISAQAAGSVTFTHTAGGAADTIELDIV